VLFLFERSFGSAYLRGNFSFQRSFGGYILKVLAVLERYVKVFHTFLIIISILRSQTDHIHLTIWRSGGKVMWCIPGALDLES
jgi:hypothetical protein